MEVKIGVQNAARELSIESVKNADDVQKALAAALESGGLFTLEDEKGRRVAVPVEKLAYVEIGEPTVRPRVPALWEFVPLDRPRVTGTGSIVAGWPASAT